MVAGTAGNSHLNQEAESTVEMALTIWNLRACPLVPLARFLQHCHTSWSFPNIAANWGPSVETWRPWPLKPPQLVLFALLLPRYPDLEPLPISHSPLPAPSILSFLSLLPAPTAVLYVPGFYNYSRLYTHIWSLGTGTTDEKVWHLSFWVHSMEPFLGHPLNCKFLDFIFLCSWTVFH